MKGIRIACQASVSYYELAADIRGNGTVIWVRTDTFSRVKSRPPVTVSLVRTEGETGSGFAMPIDLFGEPLKPFPIFFRTCALTFVFNVAVQIAPGDAHCAAQ